MDFTFIFLIGIMGIWLADLIKMPREFFQNIFLTRYAINDTGRLDIFGTKSFSPSLPETDAIFGTQMVH